MIGEDLYSHAVAPLCPPSFGCLIVVQLVVFERMSAALLTTGGDRAQEEKHIPYDLCLHCCIPSQSSWTMASCSGVSALRGVLLLALLCFSDLNFKGSVLQLK